MIENEALALIWALLLFDVYLGPGATSLIVYTNHNPLTFLQSPENPNLSDAVGIVLTAIPFGHLSYHAIADALSRLP